VEFTDTDHPRAFQLTRKAALKGSVDAAFALFQHYSTVEIDHSRSVTWLLEAIDEYMTEILLQLENAPSDQIQKIQERLIGLGVNDLVASGELDQQTKMALNFYSNEIKSKWNSELLVNQCITLAHPENASFSELSASDIDNALLLCSRARSLLDVSHPSWALISTLTGRTLELHGRLQEAKAVYKESTKTGDPYSKFLVYQLIHKPGGRLFLRSEFSPVEANDLLQSAADAGYPAAMVELGQFHLENDRTKDGIDWLEAAAEVSEVGAMLALAHHYAGTNNSTALDQGKATNWFWMAAEEEDSLEGMYEMGKRYIEGIGVGRNVELALSYYQRAAEGGYPRAMLELGRRYENGTFGTDGDAIEIAAEWLFRALKDGEAEAGIELAYIREDRFFPGRAIPESAELLIEALPDLDPSRQQEVLNELRAGLLVKITSKMRNRGFYDGPSSPTNNPNLVSDLISAMAEAKLQASRD